MAISVETFFKERKYPFIFTLMVLLICFTILLFANTTFTFDPNSFYPDVKAQPLEPNSPAITDSSRFPKDHEESPRNLTRITAPKDQGLLRQWEDVFGGVSDDLNVDWKVCKGVAAVDYIPCLDNLKVIKALRTRRHMEHRERHCPNPRSRTRCLVPLPKGYKFPVSWPKSRDMVRLLLW